MPIERDSLRNTFTNSNPLYDKILEERNIPFLTQYGTKRLFYPTTEEMSDFDVVNHIWTVGDKYWKLASIHYDDPAAWWVIGWFNHKPTEAHLNTGDNIMIPTVVEDVYSFLGI